MFVEKYKLETSLKPKKIEFVLMNNICTHSPVLNAKNIKVLQSKKIFCGICENNSFTLWLTLENKSVIVPIVYGNIENNSVNAVVRIPKQNEIMLLFWFCILIMFLIGNIAYLPFNSSKLLSLINIGAGLIFFCVTYFILKNIFRKRSAKTIEKLKELIEC